MKDSNAAPSPNSSNAPAPNSNASRGKAAAPKARAKAVSKAKARAKAKNIASPTAATPAVAPEVKVVAPEVKVVAPEVKVVAPEIMFPEALAPNAMPAKSAGARPQSAPKAAPAASAAPPAGPARAATVQGANARVAPPKAGAAVGANGKPAAVVAAVAPPRRVARKLRPTTIFAGVAALILTISGGVALGSYNKWSNSQVIAPKVRIAGEPVGGLTRDQAVAHLNKRFDKLAFTLKTDDKNMVLGLADIGGRPSVEPTVDKAFAIGRNGNLLSNFTRIFGAEVKSRSFSLPVEWNRGALTSRLQIVNKQYARPAVDARLVTVSGAAPRVNGEQSGRALDVSATADAIQKSYFLGTGKIAAVTQTVEPKITSADLAGRDVKLGEYRTEYNSGIAGRTTNIHVACRAIDGTVLMPGEVMSFNHLTGERTYQKGYRMAHIFMREAGQTQSSVVDGLAGGVCQVSSTLYNAVRKTNAQMTGKPLNIVERNSHSLPVTYVPSGRDATVAWPLKDFKFRNDNAFPVYVRTDANNGRLTISIWGRVPQNKAVPVLMSN